MNCIIIDDEPLARTEMESLIKEVSTLQVLKQFSNALLALDYLQTNEVELLFLDIEMPGLSGMDLAGCLPSKSLVIFTTAYSQYALKSYELDAIDYLLKPIDKGRLAKAIRKAETYSILLADETNKATYKGSTEDFLFIQSDRRTYKVNFTEILYIEALKDYVVIYTKAKKLITAMNLKTIHQKLPARKFIRVSKSFVVNINQIDSFDNHAVYIHDLEIPLGEIYKNDFVKRYTQDSLTPED
jgi:DNA-binding LytR/AlgR family response regulator